MHTACIGCLGSRAELVRVSYFKQELAVLISSFELRCLLKISNCIYQYEKVEYKLQSIG